MKQLVLLLSLYSSTVFSSEILKFSRNEKLMEQKIAEKIIQKIYKKINIDLEITPYPPARANKENLAQNIDGEIARIFKYGEKNPTLIRIEPPYYHLVSTAFCLKKRKLKLTSLADLKKYSVAVVRGVVHSDVGSEINPHGIVVSKPIQMFDMVLSGRADIAFDTEINGGRLIAYSKYKEIENCGALAKHDLYNYLNTRSAVHKEKVSQMISSMKKSGELEQVINQAEEEVLSSDAN